MGGFTLEACGKRRQHPHETSCEILWEKKKSPLKLYMPTNSSPTDEDQVAGIPLQLTPHPPALPHK